jgi:hypothetical protein
VALADTPGPPFNGVRKGRGTRPHVFLGASVRRWVAGTVKVSVFDGELGQLNATMAVPQGQFGRLTDASFHASPTLKTKVTHASLTTVAPLSGRHHWRRTGGHDDDRAVCVRDVGNVAGMDLHHDQEQRQHSQRPDNQRGQKPGVDFERPIHNGITYPHCVVSCLELGRIGTTAPSCRHSVKEH